MAGPRSRVSQVLAGAMVAALLAGCGGSGKGAAPSTTVPHTSAGSGPPAVRWVPCRGSAGPKGYQCASVSVPRDPLHPGGPTIPLALDRRRASGARIGSLLINPGGPGVSGVDSLPTVVADMPADLLARFDVVGFDPPGVGRTAPIVCLDAAGLERYFHTDPEPVTPAGFDAMVASDRTFAAGCQARSGPELPYVSTADAARDMDLVRQALGDPALTYMGFSYGTLLGATYADLFPTHVRALVLDGALDPSESFLPYSDEQAASLDNQLQQFFTWCAGHRSACPWTPAGDPTAAYEALLARVRAHPLPVRKTSRTVGPSELIYGTAVTLYSTDSWRDLGYALAGAAQGDGTILLELFDAYTERHADGSYSNLFEANQAINCLDGPVPSIAQLQAAAPAAERVAPIFGVQNLYSAVGCDLWPVPPTDRPAPVHGTGSPPILVVGSTGDPITPYAWAQSLAKQLEHGVLLTRVGDGHTAYGASSCIRSAVDRYLIALTVPAAGTRCPSG